MNRTNFSNRQRRLATFAVATILSTGLVATMTRGEDPAPTTSSSGERPEADMPPDWGPPPPREFGDKGEHGGPPHGGMHGPGGPGGPGPGGPGGHGGPGGLGGPPDRNMKVEHEVRKGIGIGIAPRFERWQPPFGEEINEEEWHKAVALMTEYSPTRFSLFKKIETSQGENSGSVRNLKRRMIGFARMLEETKESSPDTYEFAIKQMKVEDDIIAALEELRAGETPERQEKLNAAVRQFIQNNLDERELWLKKLEENIARQRQAMERDRANIDQLVEDRGSQFESAFARMIRHIEQGGPRDEDRPRRDGPPRGERKPENPPATQPSE